MDTWEFKRVPLEVEKDEAPIINICDFTFEAADVFIKRMQELEADQNLTSIFINVFSYGGEVDPLLAMVDTINNSSKEIHIVGLGLVCSAAAYFLALGPSGTRWMSRNCMMQIHHASSDITGNTKTLKRELDALEERNNRIFSLIAKKAQLSTKEIILKIKEHEGEWFFGAEKAKEYGFIDHIGVPKISRSEVWECEAV